MRRPVAVKEDKKFFHFHEAREVSQKLAILAASSAETALERKGLVGDHALDSVVADGARVDRDGLYDVSTRKTLLQRRNYSEMRDTLAELKQSLQRIGISIDVSSGKGISGRMQGEKWVDSEIEGWKHTASRLVGTDGVEEGGSDFSEKWRVEEALSAEVFRAKGVLNKARYERSRREKQVEELEFELAMLVDYETGQSRSDGEVSKVQDVTSKLLEQISEHEVMREAERVERARMEEEREALRVEVHEIEMDVDALRVVVGMHEHDNGALVTQMRQELHSIEKSLGQGKLRSMQAVMLEMRAKYVAELESKACAVRRQIEVKRALKLHEARLNKLTTDLAKQYDPEGHSPRRNALRSKASEFEAAFASLKARLGDQDLVSIVELLKRQQVSHTTWAEAAGEQEDRLRCMQDELEALKRQKRAMAISAPKPLVDNGGGARAQTQLERRLDNQLDRLEEAMARVGAVDDLVQNIGEAVRAAIVRVRGCVGLVDEPPAQVGSSAEDVVDAMGILGDCLVKMLPSSADYASLLAALDMEQGDKRREALLLEVTEALSPAGHLSRISSRLSESLTGGSIAMGAVLKSIEDDALAEGMGSEEAVVQRGEPPPSPPAPAEAQHTTPTRPWLLDSSFSKTSPVPSRSPAPSPQTFSRSAAVLRGTPSPQKRGSVPFTRAQGWTSPVAADLPLSASLLAASPGQMIDWPELGNDDVGTPPHPPVPPMVLVSSLRARRA